MTQHRRALIARIALVVGVLGFATSVATPATAAATWENYYGTTGGVLYDECVATVPTTETIIQRCYQSGDLADYRSYIATWANDLLTLYGSNAYTDGTASSAPDAVHRMKGRVTIVSSDYCSNRDFNAQNLNNVVNNDGNTWNDAFGSAEIWAPGCVVFQAYADINYGGGAKGCDNGGTYGAYKCTMFDIYGQAFMSSWWTSGHGIVSG